MNVDYAKYGLSAAEYARAQEIIGREPNHTELGMIGAMWSEHCSYKSSRHHLSRFPTKGPRVLQGPGENAGVVDLGEGLACVFKVESHNHPSFIEPYQGAATGVGGIMRDIFTMGARPIANLNSLHFGEASHPRTKYLLSGVVAGIGGYGNCMGVPTVGGQVTFNPAYNGNILVNAFTLGLVKSDGYFTASASGVGNPIFYVGSRTGRDGIQGATMASESFDTTDPEAQAKRPTVQVGDPFTEKLLLEACLELMQTDAIIGIQDMGAAGLTSSSFEMAGRGGTGVEINIEKIPAREENMTAYEFMLSESQERMLIVARPGREEIIRKIFLRWGLAASEIGRVTGDGLVTLREHGKIVAQLPALPLSEQAPRYERPIERPAYLDTVQNLQLDFTDLKDPLAELINLISSPNLCSRAWVFEQYDQSVRTNTVQGPGGDAAVIRLKESPSGKALAISSDVNARHCYLDPKRGAAWAVLEAAQNLACVGARPIGLTNCLNFGNPENPEIMWQLSQSIDGIALAARELECPVVSGNVSLYNETDGVGIHPTPTIVMVGMLDHVNEAIGIGFQQPGDTIYLLGPVQASLSGSEYLAVRHHLECGKLPDIDWQQQNNILNFMVSAIQNRLLKSAHDLSDGGLLIALAECALASPEHGLGASVATTHAGRMDEFWFGEGVGRFLVSVAKNHEQDLENSAGHAHITLTKLGEVVAGSLKIRDPLGSHTAELEKIYGAWRHAFDRYLASGSFLIK